MRCNSLIELKIANSGLPGFEVRGVLPPKPIAACCDNRLECSDTEGAGEREHEAAAEAIEEMLVLGGDLTQAEWCGSGTAVCADSESEVEDISLGIVLHNSDIQFQMLHRDCQCMLRLDLDA